MDGGNYVTPTSVFGFVDYDYFGDFGFQPILKSNLGWYAAPQLTALNPDSCLFIYQMKIDYDNQPSSDYTTATEINYSGIEKAYVMPTVPVSDPSYDYSFSDCGILVSPYLQGKFFAVLGIKIKEGQGIDFKMVYDQDEPLDSDGSMNLYLLAKLTGESSKGESETSTIFAFDGRSLMYNARDTTVQGVDYNYVKFKINYLSTTGEITKTSAVELATFK
jgi:hypothetical protein